MDKKTSADPASAQILKNEQGFILILALLMMLTLSLTGAAAMMMRNTEQFIVTNTEISQNNFYAAEAVTMEAIVALKILADDDDKKEVLLIPDEEHTDYRWLAVIDPAEEDWPPFDLSDTTLWYQGNPDIRPRETELDEEDNGIMPKGYASNGTTDGDRIWYAVMRGTVNSDFNDRDNCGGSELSDPSKVEKCFTVFGMYDVKPGQGKAYPGQRMLMVGYRHMVYY